MDANTLTITGIIKVDRVVEIPFFQRSYVWGEDEWERLIEDMEVISSTSKPHFFGSVILKQRSTTTEESVGDKRLLVDGQQRLTTLCIFFKVLLLKLGQERQFDRLFRGLDGKTLTILHNRLDIDDFEEVLDKANLEPVSNDSQIKKAFNYFCNKINKDNLDFQKIITNLTFVCIDLHDDEDEQQIFDTINSLGVRLTTAELLKNFLFSREDLDLYTEYWESIFERDNSEKAYWDREVTAGRFRRSLIDLFFYAFLQIKVQDPSLEIKSADKREYSKLDILFESYKNFISNYGLDKSDLIKEIREYAIIFRKNLTPDVVERELPNKYGIDRVSTIIFGLENTTLIPYCLFALKNIEDTAQLEQLMEAIESFVMRRMVTKDTSKNYNLLFTEGFIGHKILSATQFVDYIESKSDKINSMPTDDELKNSFHSSKLINKQSAGVIYFIETMIRDRNRQSTQLLGLSKYSLEHLMPKNWQRKWSSLDTPLQIAERDRALMTLGNLAIITQSLNASIRDSDWDTKLNGTDKNPGLKQYARSIETVSNALDQEDWNESTIVDRADELFRHALDIW